MDVVDLLKTDIARFRIGRSMSTNESRICNLIVAALMSLISYEELSAKPCEICTLRLAGLMGVFRTLHTKTAIIYFCFFYVGLSGTFAFFLIGYIW